MMATKLNRLEMFVLAGGLVAGCGTTSPSRLYTLSAPQNIPVQLIHHEHLQDVKVVVERVIVPKYLDRPVVVTQSGSSVVVFSEFHRWAEPLTYNLTDVVMQNLGVLLPGTHILSESFMSRKEANYCVRIEVIKLTGELGKDAMIDAHWSILNGTTYKMISIGKNSQHVELKDGQHETYVAAVSELVVGLSRDIAQAFQNLTP